MEPNPDCRFLLTGSIDRAGRARRAPLQIDDPIANILERLPDRVLVQDEDRSRPIDEIFALRHFVALLPDVVCPAMPWLWETPCRSQIRGITTDARASAAGPIRHTAR